ncbi:uncharacterized protein LOC123271352 [Cotesia glomerata]|uniref:Uncharacterized protein n=1 Tax=Cotesia glomerata TaxID=32391 RepID=A0AAV7IB59_COTGL|nr:uncharacterized protein LOC123271352 [Cotesia glomerata]XP_044593592.1 uncharacterized protein LOC123271352 [Cotesia glomerata]KAH0557233.1 hypothetical protein KQX54_002042 [Cotesia glomerata]
MDNSVLLRVAVIENKPDGVKLIMSRGFNVNSVLSKTGPASGYTALHWATAKNRLNIVKQLIQNYQADINSLADDGVQPIHLASFLGYLDVLEFLLKSGADANASFDKKVLAKYVKDCQWCEDFSKMSLLTFATLTNKSLLASYLLDHGASVYVSSARNKTLLMYAVEKNHYNIACQKEFMMYDGKLLNARDDAGLHVFHYMLHQSKFGQLRFDGKQVKEASGSVFLEMMINAGADVDAMVNGDPDTLLVNMAAWRFCYDLLKIPFNLERSSKEGRPLKYVTMPVDPQSRADGDLDKEREICTRWILKILVLKRALGLFVPEEETKLMDELVNKDDHVRGIVQGFQQKFVEGFLMQRNVGETSFLEVAKMLFIRRRVDNLEILKSFMSELQDELDEEDGHFDGIDDEDEYDTQMFITLLWKKMDEVEERSELMDKLKKVVNLRKAIPLSFEIVLLVVEFLDNRQLEKFISAFYK